MRPIERRESTYRPGNEVEIKIGELVFPFFHPANYQETWFAKGETETKFRLTMDFLGRRIPLRILSSLKINERNGIELVPLHPENGYIIDQEDFDLEKRRNKLLEGIKRFGGFGIDKEFPLGFSVSICADYFVQDGLAAFRGNPDSYNQRQQVSYSPLSLSIFNTLKCRIFLPNSEFEAVLDHPPIEIHTAGFRNERNYDDYEFYFEDFYPLETGLLAHEADGTFSMEDDGSDLEVGPGHRLYFADNKGDLEKIGIEFVLTP